MKLSVARSRSVCLGMAFGLSCAVCLAQKKQASASGAHGPVACGSSKGCATFNEMLRNNDPDFRDLRDLGGSWETYFVCFIEEKGTDSFFVIGFSKPMWTKDEKNPTFEISDGWLIFTDYLNGLANRNDFQMIAWRRLSSVAVPGSHVGIGKLQEKEEGYAAQIDESSVQYLATYPNIEKQNVEYTVRVRRSTKRFEQSIQTGGITQTNTGRCVAF